MPDLTLVEVNKSFGGLRATSNVSMVVETGEVHALIGPNGAGKTTLVNLITGRLRADAGSIRLGNEDIHLLTPQARVRKGVVRTFQVTNLFGRFCAWENIALAVAERRRLALGLTFPRGFTDDVADEAEGIAQQAGLGACADKPASELSYGQQRLLEIAIALALKPKVLLLDEPAAGLPAADHHIISNVISAMAPEVAVLLIEHDMDLVFSLADTVTVLNEGAVLSSGPPALVRQDPQVKAAYLGTLHDD